MSFHELQSNNRGAKQIQMSKFFKVDLDESLDRRPRLFGPPPCLPCRVPCVNMSWDQRVTNAIIADCIYVEVML